MKNEGEIIDEETLENKRLLEICKFYKLDYKGLTKLEICQKLVELEEEEFNRTKIK